jgi:hypothetical protein
VHASKQLRNRVEVLAEGLVDRGHPLQISSGLFMAWISFVPSAPNAAPPAQAVNEEKSRICKIPEGTLHVC